MQASSWSIAFLQWSKLLLSSHTSLSLAYRSLDEVQEELYSLVVAEVDRDKGALGQLWLTEARHTDSQ